MTDHVMKLRAKGDIILAFGEELAKLRNHPELAWQHVWHDADACIFNEHDEIKEIALPSTTLPANCGSSRCCRRWGRGPVNSRDIGATTPPARCTEAGTMVARTIAPKNPYTDWRNRPYASNPNAEERRKRAERWHGLNTLIAKLGGWVTSLPPGPTLRIEIARESATELISKLTELGYAIADRGTTTRIVGAGPSDLKTERMTRVTPSPFLECATLEIRLDGR
jgi:hypothetical protein